MNEFFKKGTDPENYSRITTLINLLKTVVGLRPDRDASIIAEHLKDWNDWADKYNREDNPNKRYTNGIRGDAKDIKMFDTYDAFVKALFPGGRPLAPTFNFSTYWKMFQKPF